MSGYPPNMSGSDMCHVEGCIGKGPCPRCGNTDYAWMGYWGAIARWSRKWGISERETERRFNQSQIDKANVSP